MIIEILNIILFFVFQELLLFTFIEQVFNALFNGHTYFFPSSFHFIRKWGKILALY